MKLTERLDTLTPAQLEAARGWIADCEWPDLDDANTLTPLEVVRGVARHYAGGWSAFLSAM